MRLDITRRADLAVRAMTVLTASPERWKAPALAVELGTTVGFVPQVLGPLVKAGWVRSDPGPTGGYAAQVAAADVSVLQVIEAVDGPTDAGQCVVEHRACTAGTPCTLHVAWGVARTELTRALAATSVAEVAQGRRR
jgi:Rrf2 family transcriptional regulator, iron-sulfur cluster assembly transcription factor